LAELGVGLAAVLPKADAIHTTVPPPEALVMRMVVLLGGDVVLQRPVAGHRPAGRPDDGVEIRAARAGEMIFGEEMAVDLHGHFVRFLLEIHAGHGEGSEGGDTESGDGPAEGMRHEGGCLKESLGV
jgi:hypothetical protein